MKPVVRWLLWPLHWLLALVLLFEEWGWEPLQRLLAQLGSLPGLRWIEAKVRGLQPLAALAVFVLPSLMLLPVKVGALWLLSNGHALAGTLVIVAAKLVGTALVARLFTLTQPALMQLPWFARGYTRWAAWKEALLAQVRSSWAWRCARVLKARVRRLWAR